MSIANILWVLFLIQVLEQVEYVVILDLALPPFKSLAWAYNNEAMEDSLNTKCDMK